MLIVALTLSVLACAAAAGAAQPVAYSHKTHIALGLKCVECHTMPGKGEVAGFPPESRCMACHIAIKKDSPEIRKLAGYAAAGKARTVGARVQASGVRLVLP